MRHAATADAVIMAAAVADYMPERGPAPAKIAKADGPLEMRLVRTPDILAELGKARGAHGSPLLVGFAAETGDPRPRARRKLESKQIDLIVANDVSREGAGFDADTNAGFLLSADREVELPMQLKSDMAATILDRVEEMLARVRA